MAESLVDTGYMKILPRHDQHDRFDEQESYFNSRTTGVSFLVGGNGAGTTTISLRKIVQILLHEQPPPRKDTPFWILSEDFQVCMETCWAEKLDGMDLIPKVELDRPRIHWYKSTNNWPFRVPLKPWPTSAGGHPDKNWCLEFKSFGSGQRSLAGRAIGGFLFVEQFPWGLLEEVLRGCREFNFPGLKNAEFTPVDPRLSAPLEELLENERLPSGWEMWRANTECAMEAGHVKREWFDEFYGLISPEMRETRMTGAFAGYEGAVFPTFSRAIHTASNIQVPKTGVVHKRGIDWGAGVENAFVCLWSFKEPDGTISVYDEYYTTEQTKTIEDHVKEINTKNFWNANKNQWFRQTYGDPASPIWFRECRKYGLNVSMAKNDVDAGIETLRRMLVVNKATGRPRLIIDKERCPNLIRQLVAYRWEQSSGRGLNPRDAKKAPLKKDDHAVDALRYLVHSDYVSELMSGVSRDYAEKKPHRAVPFKRSMVGGNGLIPSRG